MCSQQSVQEGRTASRSMDNQQLHILINPHHINILSTMPRVASNHKQKNKKYKGTANKVKSTKPNENKKKKGIAKVRQAKKPSKILRLKNKKQKKQKQAEKLATSNEYLDEKTKNRVKEKLKQQNEIRIILLIPCNEHADVVGAMNLILHHLGQTEGYVIRNDLKTCTAFPTMQVFPSPRSSPIKNRFFVVASDREPKQLLDLAKCADIICPVMSVLSANPQRIVEDPYNYAGAFDETGYSTINLLRSLGLPRVVGLIQHLQKIEPKHQDKITKFYKRFLTSEFGDQKSMTLQSGSDITSLFRTFDSCGLVNQPWKNERGFMLADQAEVNEQGNLMISGFVKGNCINPNQLVHITGYDDYQIEKIDILAMGTRTKLAMQVENPDNEELSLFTTVPEDLNPFSKPEAEDEDILSAIKGLQLEEEESRQNEPEQEDASMNEEEEEESEVNWESESEEEEGNKADEKAKRVQMQMRTEDELEFEDEVEYAAEQILRDKYREFQGLKSFKTSLWNNLENLPSQYDRIFFFKNYNKTFQSAIKDNLARGFAYPGFYVKITIKDLKPEQLATLGNLPLVLSFLLKHERKMTVVHGKVDKNPYYAGQNNVNSNELVMVSIGFKRLLVEPLYSRLINGTDKTKYTKAVGKDYENHYFCSFYGHNYFPSSPFLVFRVNRLNTSQIEPAPILKGELAKCDPNHVILERIIITGYPYKINRRRCTVRYMFFNPGDVKYFKPVEIRTRLGLRGKVQQSLGTHGLLKVFFNDPIKQNDTICMSLYRRMYPSSSF